MEAANGRLLRGVPSVSGVDAIGLLRPIERFALAGEDRHGPGLAGGGLPQPGPLYVAALLLLRPPAVPGLHRGRAGGVVHRLRQHHLRGPGHLGAPHREDGVRSLWGALAEAGRGVLILPAAPHDRQACDPNTRFAVPAQAGASIALIARGNCTCRDKIRHAAVHNASAVVIFNVGSANANDTITMPHHGTGEVVTAILSRGISHATAGAQRDWVTMTHHHRHEELCSTPAGRRCSLHLLHIALMIISSPGSLTSIQRFRYANAETETSFITQTTLPQEAKKAISKLQVRTIRKGDQETRPTSTTVPPARGKQGQRRNR
ncbi:RING finger protein 150-like protein [Lates japonicus]|uniref:RING finger protein 150-like protein n=1 Tax=Lates japonicus TaxID=270547 RepID=A0AAD3NIS7_LATJO|nr:RING finger protein 150-like protein [Lates japonicus]